MKTLSVSQPWASVICSGMKDVENRKWQATQVPGRILIQATAAKPDDGIEFTLCEYAGQIRNARLMGWIPEYKDMPRGAIIGYLDVFEIVRNSDSFWAQKDSFHWCLKDAYVFDEPILNVKGVQGHLFEYSIDEANLPPAHKVDIKMPVRNGDVLTIPASDNVISDIEKGCELITYDLNEGNFLLFADTELNALDTKKVIFVGKDKTIEKECVGVETYPIQDENGHVYTYKSQHDQDMEVWEVALYF